MSSIIEYKDYFFHQVSQHPELNAAGEINDIFAIKTFEEAIAETRSLVATGGYLFRLLVPTWGLSGGEGDSLQINNGGFLICKNYNPREDDSNAMLAAISDTERIAGHFASKMVMDSQNGHPLFHYSIDTFDDLRWNAQTMLGLGDGTYLGQFCTFYFATTFNACSSEGDAPMWGDGGLTPLAG